MTERELQKLLDSIYAGKDARKSLIELKEELRDPFSMERFRAMPAERKHTIVQALHASDPKIRKNAALILGMLEDPSYQKDLFEAWISEHTLFVKASYLKALSATDCSMLVPQMRDQESRLLSQIAESDEAGRKHLYEELTALRGILNRYQPVRHHRFSLQKEPDEVILITNREQREITEAQIHDGTVRRLAGGLRISGGRLEDLMKIRTFSEILFPIKGLESIAGTPEQIGTALGQADISGMLDGLYEGGGVYEYRVDIKGRIPQEKKGAFIRRITSSMESIPGSRLVNNPSGYEVEIRLLEKKDGSFVPFLKLASMPDERFSYRRGMTAESIAPVNAALTVQLALPYLKEGAQILDPFCGVGTMLIERDKAVKAGSMYGIDLFGEAVRIGRENAEAADCRIYFINRDFRDFTHEYRFDEVITDMPRQYRDSETGEWKMPEDIYRDFFRKMPSLLKDEAVLILYAPMNDAVENGIKSDSRFSLIAKFLMNEKAGIFVSIIQYQNC